MSPPTPASQLSLAELNAQIAVLTHVLEKLQADERRQMLSRAA